MPDELEKIRYKLYTKHDHILITGQFRGIVYAFGDLFHCDPGRDDVEVTSHEAVLTGYSISRGETSTCDSINFYDCDLGKEFQCSSGEISIRDDSEQYRTVYSFVDNVLSGVEHYHLMTSPPPMHGKCIFCFR